MGVNEKLIGKLSEPNDDELEKVGFEEFLT